MKKGTHIRSLGGIKRTTLEAWLAFRWIGCAKECIGVNWKGRSGKLRFKLRTSIWKARLVGPP